MVRDRVLALGMRRPYRLHKDPFEEPLISELDFGLEATSPFYTDIQSKRVSIMGFIWLCKLSEIMAAIAVFQRRHRFSRDWDGDAGGINASELEEVSGFDQDLKDWQQSFEAEATDIAGRDGKDSAIPFIILRVVCKWVPSFPPLFVSDFLLSFSLAVSLLCCTNTIYISLG